MDIGLFFEMSWKFRKYSNHSFMNTTMKMALYYEMAFATMIFKMLKAEA